MEQPQDAPSSDGCQGVRQFLGLPRSHFQAGTLCRRSDVKNKSPVSSVRSLSGGGRNWKARGDCISSSLSVLIVTPSVSSPAGARGSSRCCPARGAPAATQLRRLSREWAVGDGVWKERSRGRGNHPTNSADCGAGRDGVQPGVTLGLGSF